MASPPDRASSPRLEPGQAAAILGVASAAWAVFLLPPFFGALGVALGAYAWWRGERRGRWVIVGAVVATLLGLGLSLLPDWFVSN